MKKILTVAGIALVTAAVAAEWKKGSFVCPECNCRIKPNFKEFALSPHIFTTRYLNCPSCGRRRWFKKEW
jgi:DNA-directed RNA polymerase subunit RPC12/RpoP